MKPKKVRKPPENKIRKFCFEIIKSKKFINIITGFNLLNIVTFMLYHHRQPALMEEILSFFLIFLLIIFIFRLYKRGDYFDFFY